MRKIFTLFAGLLMAVMPSLAQNVDYYVFVDENGNVLDDEAVVVRTAVATDSEGRELINAGISVKNVGAAATDLIKMYYMIEQIDNGDFQICFPATCNTQNEEGFYETTPAPVSDIQDIQSEWFPIEDGTCIVTLLFEVVNKKSGFPPTYESIADGPTLTVKFVKGATTIVGDIDGDGEVTVSDINALIDLLLSSAPYDKVADVDGDGEIGISDINALIDIILSNN